MILRPLEPPPGNPGEWASAWPVVERLQQAKHDRCWMITQPSHAALASSFAECISDPQFPRPDRAMLRAIALHDAGWGALDAQAVQKSRAKAAYHPESFVALPVVQLLDVWIDSIAMAQSTGAAGGYAVSSHFSRIAAHRAEGGKDSAPDRRLLETFVAVEAARQKKLAAQQSLPAAELDRLTDLLQFCDLLSLYVCCGAQESAVFPKYCGVEVRAEVEADGLRLVPQIIPAGAHFMVAALRHPAEKDLSSQEMVVRVL
jgi:hypothetical protein